MLDCTELKNAGEDRQLDGVQDGTKNGGQKSSRLTGQYQTTFRWTNTSVKRGREHRLSPNHFVFVLVPILVLLLVIHLIGSAMPEPGDDSSYEQIVTNLTEDIALMPDNAELYHTLGDVHFEHHTYGLALDNYQIYMELAGDWADILIPYRIAFLQTQLRMQEVTSEPQK